MKEKLKLRNWVKVMLTIILLVVIIVLHSTAMKGGNFAVFYWFMLVPFSFLGLTTMWEA